MHLRCQQSQPEWVRTVHACTARLLPTTSQPSTQPPLVANHRLNVTHIRSPPALPPSPPLAHHPRTRVQVEHHTAIGMSGALMYAYPRHALALEADPGIQALLQSRRLILVHWQPLALWEVRAGAGPGEGM